jgi:dipeptidyl aminopeptidase/acylaminoacyl peptidase
VRDDPSNDRDGWLAIADGDGKIRWQATPENVVNRASIVGDAIVSVTSKGLIESRARSDGALRWQRPLGTSIEGIGSAGGRLFAVDQHAGIIVLDPDSGTELTRYAAELVNASPTLSSDAQRLALIDYDHGAVVIALDHAEDLRAGAGDAKGVRMDLSPDGHRAAIGGADGDLSIVALGTGRVEHRVHAHDKGVGWVAFDHDGRRLATGGRNGDAALWDVETGGPIATVDHGGPVNKVAFAPDGGRLASAGQDGLVRIWSVPTGVAIGKPLRLPGSITGLRWSPDGARLAAIDQDGGFAVWNASTGEVLRHLDPSEFGEGIDVAFSPDGARIAIARHDAKPTIYALDGGADVALSMESTDPELALQWNHRGDRIAFAGDAGRVRVFDAATGARVASLEGLVDTWALAWSPDDAMIATGDWTPSIRVWDASTGIEIAARAAAGMPLQLRWPAHGDAIAEFGRGPGLIWRVPSPAIDASALATLSACFSGWRIDPAGGLVPAPTDPTGCKR